jgi:predicted transcriptional regulator
MPEQQKPADVTRTFRVDKETDDKLAELAWQRRSSKSAEIRKAITKILSEEQAER